MLEKETASSLTHPPPPPPPASSTSSAGESEGDDVLAILEILHLLLPIVTARHHGSHLLNLIVILSNSTNRTVDTVSRMNEIYIELAQVDPMTHSLTHLRTHSLTYLLTHSHSY